MMKRSLLFIILISLLPFVSIFFTPELPHTSDGGVQIPRMAAFFTALKDGHVPVRWAGDLNYGYGLPLFNFIYHTPFFVSSVLIAIGIPLIDTFKYVLLFSFISSGVGMYLFARTYSQDERIAVLVTLLYQFAPYRLVEILTRGSIGGIYAYACLPFTLYCIVLLWKKPSLRSITGIAFFGGLMILSHNALALLFFGCIIVFTILCAGSIKKILLTGFGLVGALGLSAYYWIPALLDHKYTYGDLFMKDLYRSHFPPFQNFFIPNLFNLESLRTAEINVHIGIIHTVLLIMIPVILLLRKQYIDKTTMLFSAVITAISFFFMTELSLPLWERISFLRQFQFPWRFLAVIIVGTSFLGFTLQSTKIIKHWLYYHLLLLAIIVPTMFYWRPVMGWSYGVTNEYFWNYPLNTTYFGETDVIWSAGPAQSYPKERIEVIEGNAVVNEFKKVTQRQIFSVTADTNARLVSHTQFFPGWRVFVNGAETDIQFQDPHWRGLITFVVPQGTHSVVVEFGETKIRAGANALSLLTGGILLSIYIYSFKKKPYA